MNYTPKNILKGKTSKGDTFTIREWDFETLATLETFGFLWMLIICLIFSSVAGPILTLISLFAFTGRFRLTYVLSLLISSYFLYDCYHGWISLGALNLFFEEKTINKLVYFNGASIIVTLILLIFGNAIGNAIKKPITELNDTTYEALPTGRKNVLNKKVENRKFNFIIVMFIVYFFSLFIVEGIIDSDKGWVKRNIHKETESIPYEETLTPKERKEREEYFDKIEKRWGN
jgi:hypothetical protein